MPVLQDQGAVRKRARLFRLIAFRHVLFFASLIIVLLSGAGAWAAWLQVSGNVHAVRAGEVYRSAQLSPDQLTDVVDRYDIKSILNLRGRNESHGWWIAETAIAERYGIVHADLGFSARRIPDDVKLARLLELMRDLPKPLLIHCHGGADRTGLASALYLAAIAGEGERVAEGQLSFRFGHVGLPLSEAWPMDETWEHMEQVLGLEEDNKGIFSLQ